MSVPKRPYCFARCQNIQVPKIPCAKNSLCQNIPVLKSPSAGTSPAPNGACAEMFPWWNIHAEMTLADMFCTEMVYRPFQTYLWDTKDFWKKFEYRILNVTWYSKFDMQTLSYSKIYLCNTNYISLILLFISVTPEIWSISTQQQLYSAPSLNSSQFSWHY